MSTLQPVRSPVSKFPLTSEDAATAELPLDARMSAIVANEAAIAANIVERIGCLPVRSTGPCMSLRPMRYLPSVGGRGEG